MRSYFEGRDARVVGGSQGIGKALAAELLARGARVTILARDEARLSEVAAELKCASRVVDVTSWSSVEAALGDGEGDLVLNCAGLALPGYLHELSVEDIDRMTAVNYSGTVHVCKAALPGMLARRRGHLVNVSSLAGFLGLFGYTGYCGSKYAVIGFSEALRREVAGQGVRVSVLCPPNTRTPGLEAENLRKPAEVLATEEKAQTLEPEVVARYTLDRLARNPFRIIPNLDGRLALGLSRFLPFVLDQILKRPAANP